MLKTGEHLDILAISCDSFDPETNRLIGRGSSSSQQHHLESLERVRNWCRDYQVAFKINTVVNVHNLQEDMNESIKVLNPIRWKVSKKSKFYLYSNFLFLKYYYGTGVSVPSNWW